VKSFLEFCFHELVGPPRYGSSWFCVWCNVDGENDEWASLSVRPPKGNYPIKMPSLRQVGR
jgi:hypothetical protein